MESLQSVIEAADRIKPYLRPTPLIYSVCLSRLTGKEVWLKLETQQPTGSFKIRPAFNGILSNFSKARRAGVLATSSGNFAQAVAYAANYCAL